MTERLMLKAVLEHPWLVIKQLISDLTDLVTPGANSAAKIFNESG
jgi:hypothetical protein